jgi:UDP-N-acetylglucosamine 4,6-dehydratase
VRYGNVMGSRGSVIPYFLQKRGEGVLPITDPGMTRFNITLEEGVEMVLYALEHSLGGEVFVPKIPSYRILDVAEAIGPECEKPVVGIRPGEKLHEEMITDSDSPNTLENDRYYTIVPSLYGHEQESLMQRFLEQHGGRKVPEGFSYASGSNTDWLSVEQIRELIRAHVDPGFSV